MVNILYHGTIAKRIELPVISTRLKDLSETFDNDCITYIKNDKRKDISEAIKFLCFHRVERKRKLMVAKQKLSEISGAVMKERFVQTYNELTTSKPIHLDFYFIKTIFLIAINSPASNL